MKLFPITIPGGSDTYFQFNDEGIFSGSAYATINKTTGVSTFTGVTTLGVNITQQTPLPPVVVGRVIGFIDNSRIYIGRKV